MEWGRGATGRACSCHGAPLLVRSAPAAGACTLPPSTSTSTHYHHAAGSLRPSAPPSHALTPTRPQGNTPSHSRTPSRPPHLNAAASMAVCSSTCTAVNTT